ncbi:MAG TPA: GvpL/GvpF family gas vesicle protein [Vicinamibacterales bacterium]
MTLCVYSLASPPGGRIIAIGIGGERLSAITVGRVAAIAGELARPPRPSETALRGYDRVLRSLSERLPAVIPVRFGTCVADLDELTMILRARQETFRSSLRAVRGRVQMTVRVVPGSGIRDPGSEERSPTADRGSRVPGPGSHVTGVAYMRARATALGREREIPGFDPVRQAVRRWVRDERVERRGRVASVYHLVPRGSAQAYRRALERSAPATGIRVMVSGPWPPYAFSSPF